MFMKDSTTQRSSICRNRDLTQKERYKGLIRSKEMKELPSTQPTWSYSVRLRSL